MIQRIEHGPILELNLSRPPANALSPELIALILQSVREAPSAGAQGLVLSGQPGIFSGGLDVPDLLGRSREEMAQTWTDFFALLEALAKSPVPIAAAVTGHSPAGGAVMTLFGDRRFMAEGPFKIGLNEVQVGLPMPPVIYRGVERLVGPRHAERLSVGGLLIPGEEALAVGLVDELAPVDEVVPRAVAWVESLLAMPRQAMLETRQLARADLCVLFDGPLDLDPFVDRWFSDETQGAMRAMVARLAEKRG